MSDFRNAYHFVPRRVPNSEVLYNAPNNQKIFGLTEDTRGLGHAIYAPDTYSGRLDCIITLETPIVVGAKRHTNNSHHSEVEPFLFKGAPAVPATSIKGVVSSVAEAASRAPYRVLENMKLTVREGGPKGRRFKHQNPINGMGTTYDYFAPASLPASASRTNTIHVVETMFGFVRANETSSQSSAINDLVSVAGKLRFSHGLLTEESSQQAAEAFFVKGDYPPDMSSLPKGTDFSRLKEQGQPMKSPPNASDVRSAVPNFYFKRTSNPESYISKADFAQTPAEEFSPQGGKFYLHNPDGKTSEPWKTKNGESKTRKTDVLPLKAGTTFEFSVQFDNLSEREFQLLCFALQPTKQFRHKIGLGKALGLGSIQISIRNCALIDRQKRYDATSIFENDERVEQTKPMDSCLAIKKATDHKTWLETNDQDALNALLAIGELHNFDRDDANTSIPVVWVPLTEAKLNNQDIVSAELKSFQWFSDNDRNNNGQKLLPISSRSDVPLLSAKKGAKTPHRTAAAKIPQKIEELAPDEKRGMLKFFNKNKKTGTVIGYVTPITPPRKDVLIPEKIGIAAGLLEAKDNANTLVIYTVDETTGGPPKITSIRLV